MSRQTRISLKSVFFALCLVPTFLVMAAGGPLSQMLRLAVVGDERSSGAAVQYDFVFFGMDAAAESPDSDTETKKDDAPRLLKPISDIWETASRVETGSADVAGIVALVAPEKPAPDTSSEIVYSYYRTHNPPNPPSRGPPQTA